MAGGMSILFVSQRKELLYYVGNQFYLYWQRGLNSALQLLKPASSLERETWPELRRWVSIAQPLVLIASHLHVSNGRAVLERCYTLHKVTWLPHVVCKICSFSVWKGGQKLSCSCSSRYRLGHTNVFIINRRITNVYRKILKCNSTHGCISFTLNDDVIPSLEKAFVYPGNGFTSHWHMIPIYSTTHSFLPCTGE